jgi:hypothetical protein
MSRRSARGLWDDDLHAIIERLAKNSYGRVDGIGKFERVWRLACGRGPEGDLADRVRLADDGLQPGHSTVLTS